MKNKYTIYIPSKKRSNNCKTAIELQKEDINFKIVVEKNDLKNYLKFYNKKNIIVLDKENQGIAYARQFIKKYSSNKKELYHWQMDDDLSFLKRKNNKNIKCSALYNIRKIEKYVQKYKNIGIASMRNSVFAFSLKPKYSINRQCVTSFLINNKCKAKFRNNIIEDTDFNMQVLVEGWCTIIFNRLLFNNPPVAKNKGGNTESHYAKITTLQKNLIKQWPKCFELKLDEKNGQTKIKPSQIWKKFPQTLLKNNQKNHILELKL